MKKLVIVLATIACMVCTACGNSEAENATTKKADADKNVSVDTSEKWVTMPEGVLYRGRGSGIVMTNPIGLNLFGAEYYVVNSYNRRELKSGEGVECLDFGKYKVTKNEIEYYTNMLYCDEKDDYLTVIAYDGNDKIIGYSMIHLCLDENGDTVGEEKYTASTTETITVSDVEKQFKSIFSKDMFNEALVINENLSDIEAKNSIFTNEVYKYIKLVEYYEGTLDKIEEMDAVTINDVTKISSIFEMFMKMEFEKTDINTSQFEEQILFGLSNGCSFSVYLGEDIIMIDICDMQYSYKMTDENKKEIEQIRGVIR